MVSQLVDLDNASVHIDEIIHTQMFTEGHNVEDRANESEEETEFGDLQYPED